MANGAWDRPEIPRPSRRVVSLLVRALDAERRAYVLNGGSRDFQHERAQDEAFAFVQLLAGEPVKEARDGE